MSNSCPREPASCVPTAGVQSKKPSTLPARPNTEGTRCTYGLQNGVDLQTSIVFFKRCHVKSRGQDWTGRTLSEYFVTDFENLNVNKFNVIPDNNRCQDYEFFRLRGIFVKKGLGIPISEVLAELVESDTEWLYNDRENPMLVNCLRQASNKTYTTTYQHKDAE